MTSLSGKKWFKDFLMQFFCYAASIVSIFNHDLLIFLIEVDINLWLSSLCESVIHTVHDQVSHNLCQYTR
ncbi:Uncharacterised protein [Vibrio cholerae]|nr:Uncharacterised protein [Vibrio cholerae]